LNPKVSILVPIYNVSNYIERCAKSLFNQTFQDIEFIFVDDATPDDSIEKLIKIIEQYPNRKEQVKIIYHPLNKGLATTRNTAINVSTGKYILVVDSDDYIEPNMIQLLYEKAIIDNADIVVSDFYFEYSNKTIYCSDYLSLNENNHLKDLIGFNNSQAPLWNKLVNSDLYKKKECRVPDGLNYYEDRYTVLRLYYFANKIVKINQAFYHYNKYNDNAITNKIVKMHFENVLRFWNLFDDFLRKYNEFEKYEKIMYLPKAQSKARLMVDTNSKELRKEFANIFQFEEKQCFSSFRLGEKIMLLLIRFKFFNLAQLYHIISIFKNKFVQSFQTH